MRIQTAAAATLLLAATACTQRPQWTLNGHIDNDVTQTVVLQEAHNGTWVRIDSAAVGNDGNFAFTRPAPQHPTVYRLSFGARQAFFPIDSVETLTLTAGAHGYTLDGTPQAQAMTRANELLARLPADSTKLQLANLLLQDPAGNTAYYIINATDLSGNKVFDPANPTDLRVIGAVANAFSEQRPSDPRTANIRNIFLTQKAINKQLNGQGQPTEVMAAELAFPDIELPDPDGKNVALSAVAAKGPVIVCFTRYEADFSPALNLLLGEALEENAGKHLQVYQIALDNNEVQWRQTARSLPWTAVYNLPAHGARNLLAYNVTQLPALFLIDADGQLVERIDNPDGLKDTIAKHL